MQSVSSRIWTRVAVSISYDENNYTMGTSWSNTNKLVLDIAQILRTGTSSSDTV